MRRGRRRWRAGRSCCGLGGLWLPWLPDLGAWDVEPDGALLDAVGAAAGHGAVARWLLVLWREGDDAESLGLAGFERSCEGGLVGRVDGEPWVMFWAAAAVRRAVGASGQGGPPEGVAPRRLHPADEALPEPWWGREPGARCFVLASACGGAGRGYGRGWTPFYAGGPVGNRALRGGVCWCALLSSPVEDVPGRWRTFPDVHGRYEAIGLRGKRSSHRHSW